MMLRRYFGGGNCEAGWRVSEQGLWMERAWRGRLERDLYLCIKGYGACSYAIGHVETFQQVSQNCGDSDGTEQAEEKLSRLPPPVVNITLCPVE